jgi:hypothetical protein
MRQLEWMCWRTTLQYDHSCEDSGTNGKIYSKKSLGDIFDIHHFDGAQQTLRVFLR